MNRKRLLISIVALYIFIIAQVVLFRHKQIQENLESQRVEALQTAAINLEYQVMDYYHDEFNRVHPFPGSRYNMLRQRLNNYVQLKGIHSVFSLVREGEQYYFAFRNDRIDIVSGCNCDNNSSYTPYTDPPPDVIRAFDTMEPNFHSSYTGSEGMYYAAYVPKKSKQGAVYVLGATMLKEEHDAVFRENEKQMVLMVAFLLVPLLPFSLIFYIQIRNREELLLKQLYCDSLTDLPNRNRFIHDCENIPDGIIAAIMLDIDSFRDINNMFGGSEGDKVLCYAARLIQEHCTDKDRLYKFPADEYVIICRNRQEEEVLRLTNEILHAFSTGQYVTKGQALNLTISAGVVFRPATQSKLLSSANIAKIQAKQGRKGYVVYESSMNMEAHYSKNYFWLNSLKEALKEDQIIPYYQPIYNNFTGRIEKYEALVRMIQPDGSVVTPDNFLPVAMKSKMYKKISHVMIDRVFRDFGERLCTVSINMAVQDLQDDETIEYIFKQVEKYGMQGRIVLEVLESEYLLGSEKSLSLLESFREKGIRIAIDDFGSGYSNFGYMTLVPMDFLKIDGSIITSLMNEKSSETVVAAISAFSRERDIPLIAEFVPDRETMDKLISLKVEYSQGYYIGKPVPFGELVSTAKFKSCRD